VILSLTAPTGREFVPYLKRLLPKAAALIPRCPTEVSVALVGNKTMADLHLRFLAIPGPTDVLTFELDHDTRGRVTAGEVVVCVPHARRVAGQNGVATRDEILLYALHGLLHLAGHDDTTPPAFRKMHRAEDRILTRLGVGAVFSREPSANEQPRRSRGARTAAPRTTRRRTKGV
jgi:probable rRNA maturation factor